MKQLNKSQRILDKDKRANDFKWYKEKIDELNKLSFSRNSSIFEGNDDDIDEYRKNRINYDLVNNRIDKADFEYIVKPFGDEVGELPATFTNKDIISTKIKVLQGLEMKRPFSWKVIATNEDVTTRREQEEFGRHRQFVTSQIMQPIQEQVLMKYEQELKGRELTPEEQTQVQQQIQEEIEAATPDEVRKYMIRDHQDPVEAMAHQLLQYLMQKNNLVLRFNDGWKHALITAKEIYHVTAINGETVVKVVNPLRFDHDDSADITFIEDGEWAVSEFRMTPSQVIETFDLTDKEIDELYELYNHNASSEFTDDDWFNYDADVEQNKNTIRVLHVVFKSLAKIGYLKYRDPETGQIVEDIKVDESYKLQPELGDISIDWKWIPSVYGGYKIGKDNYQEMGPLVDQYRDLDDLYNCKLPYYGAVYDNMNSVATSFVDRMKVYQYYYDIIMYRLELLLASDKGKIVMMNVNAIPKSAGIDLKQWMYYMDASKYGFFNPNEEANRGAGASGSAGDMAKVLDLSLISDIQKYVELAQYIETQCGNSVGVTKQIEGQIGPNEAVRNTQQNIVQTSQILEPYFDLHNHVKKNVIQGMLENAKITYANSPKKKLTYILDDLSRHILDLDQETLMLSNYGIFVSNSLKAQEAKDLITQLAHAALQNQKIELSDVAKIIRSDGIQEAEEMLLDAEGRRRAEEAKLQQQQQEHEQQMAKKARDFTKEEWQHDEDMMVKQENLKTERELQKQAMLSMGFNEDKDIDDDGVPDILEIFKQGKDAEIKEKKQKLDEDKLEQQKKEHTDKMTLENKKLKKQNNNKS